MATVPYVVRTGEYLSQIAHRFGVTVKVILDEPANAELKKARTNPEILSPGDVVYIPQLKRKWLPVNVGATNAFSATVPMVTVQVTLHDQTGQPLASKPVTTTPKCGDAPLTTDGDGLLKLEVSMLVTAVDVTVDGNGPRFHVRVGGLDPHDTDSGIISRLRQLGHLGSEEDAVGMRGWANPYIGDDLVISRGVEVFQDANGQDVTGTLDDKLRSDIRDAHGC